MKVKVNAISKSVQTQNPNTTSSVSAATQAQTDAGTATGVYVEPATLAAKALLTETYGTVLTFSTDKYVYHDATGETITFTIAASGNINGKSYVILLNKPTAVSVTGGRLIDTSSSIDSTKLNIVTITYLDNVVVYSIILTTAL